MGNLGEEYKEILCPECTFHNMSEIMSKLSFKKDKNSLHRDESYPQHPSPTPHSQPTICPSLTSESDGVSVS